MKKHQEALDALKKAKAKPEEQEPIKQPIQACGREIREIESKAQSIEDAAFDLKAVNPNANPEEDSRTSAQPIEFIEDKSRKVQAAPARLKAM